MMCTQYEQKLVFYRPSAVYSSSSSAMMGKGIFWVKLKKKMLKISV